MPVDPQRPAGAIDRTAVLHSESRRPSGASSIDGQEIPEVPYAFPQNRKVQNAPLHPRKGSCGEAGGSREASYLRCRVGWAGDCQEARREKSGVQAVTRTPTVIEDPPRWRREVGDWSSPDHHGGFGGQAFRDDRWARRGAERSTARARTTRPCRNRHSPELRLTRGERRLGAAG
jgi:hypothetical protein